MGVRILALDYPCSPPTIGEKDNDTMNRIFTCPVCSAASWESHVRYHYAAWEHHLETSGLTNNERLRRRILFEVWFPNAEVVELQSVLCKGCGFMTYAPRPSADDIESKYRFLQETERDIGGSGTSKRALAMDRRRAESTWRAVLRHAPAGRRRVLDFGGGDGKLLAPFLERGDDCFLIDYNIQPLPGITKLADTLDEVPCEERFDVIICSHVLEHVAEPGQILRELGRRLAAGGVLYGEVPAEIWRGAPITRDPVTHVNFFTLPSFEELFRRHDLRLLESRQARGSYGGFTKPVLVVVAAPGRANGARPAGEAARHTRGLLDPGPAASLAHRWQTRPTAPTVLRRALRPLRRWTQWKPRS
jgi:SAM-dependent methyltransferase